MQKFRIYKDSIEIKYSDRKDIKAGATQKEYGTLQDFIAKFETKSEAQEALKNYKSSIAEYPHHFVFAEYYIIDFEISEDDEQPGFIWDFSELKIDVVERTNCNTLSTFDNYADAEKFVSDYEGDDEVYISFN